MASYSTGVTATWGGVTFEEVFDLSWTYGGGEPIGRDEIWSSELGSLTLSCFGTANVSTDEWGQRKELVITGGGAALTHYAICESVAVQYGLNDVTRFTVTFKLTDE